MLKPVLIEIKPSKKIKGEIGVFSTRPIKKDSIIVPAEHFSNMKFISWKEFDRFDKITKKKVMDYCPAGPKGFMAPPDLNYLSIAWHMNHSCEPNVGFNKNDDFVAMRNIKKGEELNWDYGYCEANPKFKMKCSCKSKYCRKIVTGNDWKELMKDKNKYKYFSPNIMK